MDDPTGSPRSTAASFPIVGIGASAGGLEALSELLSSLPAAPGMAFLLVQHLAPAHESLLPELLGKHTALPVTQVEQDEAIVPDHIYVIAPNTTLTIEAGALHVAARGEQPHTPIDQLFQSLATELGHRAIGVVLSGGGSDGTRGLGAIKEAGGISFAQDPVSAKFSSMCRSAIDSGAVDFVARPSEIARELVRVSSHPYVSGSVVSEGTDAPAGEVPSPLSDEQHLKAMFRLLHNAGGVDFTHYKRATILRRVARRMALNHAEPLANYLKLLQDDANEQRALVQDLLIRVTNFFRDPETFEALSRIVFPALLKGRSANDPLRIWVPGCASGEEVYSIAICLFEFLGASADSTEVQIFGTDVNDLAIERARGGRYLHTISAEVSAERLQRYFVKLDDHYQIAKRVRDRCVFATQNVARDPPFSRVDLVSCRNLLIYLDHVLQRRALGLFHYALKADGFLLLGASESVGQGEELFELVDRRHHIYARKAVAAHLTGAFEGRAAHPAAASTRPSSGELERPDVSNVHREVDRAFARYGPAGVIVDDNLNIIEFRGDIEPYLELTSGAASLSLHRLARPGLLVALAPAIQQAGGSGVSVHTEAIRVDGAKGVLHVHVEVVPLQSAEGEARCYLVVFKQPAGRRDAEPGFLARWFGWARRGHEYGRAAELRQDDAAITGLNRQLEETRNFLRATIAEHETVKEELKSAHEEVLSANEEFQSTNEELETAKEELQSANEELVTTNDELRSRNRELGKSNEALTDARDYADLIIETVRDPLLVLDGELRVMRANQAFYDTFKSRPQNTEQFRIYDLDDGQWDIAALRAELGAILPGDSSFRDFEVIHTFPRVGAKSLLLNARRLAPNKQRPEMILLALEDITEHKAAEHAVRRSESRFRALVDSNVIGMILQSDEYGHISEVNDAFLTMVGYTREDLRAGRLRWDHMTPPEYVPRDRNGMAEANAQGACTPYEKEYIRKDGRRVPVLIGYAPVEGEPGNYVGFVLDLTQRKALEDDLRRHSEQLQQGARRKDEYLAMLAHELRNPLTPIRNAAEILRRVGTADATVQWSREVIDRQVEHMTRIVDDLLDVSRISSGKIFLHRSVLTLGQILEHALEAARPAMDSRKQKLTIDLPPEPVYINGDIVRLSQVLSNLLNNAAKYTDDGGEIELTARCVGDEVSITVRDNGIGIRADLLPHVFDLFVQGDHSLARSRGGLGIGLTLVRQLAEMHGGRVSARSEGPGKGSEFTVWLPIARDQRLDLASATVERVPADISRRILIVEDNVDAGESLQMLIAMGGHDVRLAQDGESALRIAQEFGPEVVVLDLGLPNMDGYEVIQRLRAHAGAVRPVVVALTGYGQPEDRRRTQEAGFDHHLMKPLAPGEFMAIVASLENSRPGRSG